MQLVLLPLLLLLLLVQIIKIPFSHVKSISKEKTAGFIPNAISVITGKREYCFRSFWDRSAAQ
jgi:hypothetical protein